MFAIIYDASSLSNNRVSWCLVKLPLATARAASCDGRVHLFVCLVVCLSVAKMQKNAIFSKTKQF